MCPSQLCEQVAGGVTGCGAPWSGPAGVHCSSGKNSASPPGPPPRPHSRPRPASVVLDPAWTSVPGRHHLYSQYVEGGSLCRRRRRPAPSSTHLSPGQRRTAARLRPRSVIETSVTMETQATEHRLRVRCPTHDNTDTMGTSRKSPHTNIFCFPPGADMN